MYKPMDPSIFGEMQNVDTMSRKMLLEKFPGRWAKFEVLLGDEGLYKLINNGAILAGGALRSFFANQPVNDYDFCFLRERDFNAALDLLNSWNKLPGTVNCCNFEKDGVKVQLIKPLFISPAHVIGGIDFHCNALAYYGYTLYMSPFTLTDIASRRLQPNCIKTPEEGVLRLQKFVLEGWKAEVCDLYSLTNSILLADKANPLDPF